ncbi:oxidoreductase [Cryptosporangium minutisporangium]|uniref:Oxidoreductase n=1 Tax=Cryptosporangium minutisporangium TaxID=113569 RepID=A0ABP6STT1_9ACTN
MITGASSGFGRALAVAAAEAGDVVVATARRTETLTELAEQYPDRITPMAFDVTDTAAATDVVSDVLTWHGRIDVLVNNAGRGQVGAVEDTTEAELRDLFDVHVFGPAALTRAVLPHMRRQRSGVIVQMSSFGGQVAYPGFGAYCATKFALEGLSEALAGEVAPHGVRVLIVEPGAFRTGFSGGALHESAISPAYAATAGATRNMIKGIDGTQPGDPAKAAAAILTAVSDPTAPLRLPLGDDAVDGVRTHATGILDDLARWESLSRDVNLDPATEAAPVTSASGSGNGNE